MVGKLYETTPRAGAPPVTGAFRGFNSRRFIRAALDGPVAQTHRALGIVVCDDSINRTGATLSLLERNMFDAS
jgi:hypothetical protein